MPKRAAETGLEPHYRVPEVAAAKGVKTDVVYGWIHTDELRAVDVSAKGQIQGKRPRWRISASALAEFDAKRAAVISEPPIRRVRRRKLPHVTEYF